MRKENCQRCIYVETPLWTAFLRRYPKSASKEISRMIEGDLKK
jgi:hypothetical protein